MALRKSPIPLYLQIDRALLERIESGELPPMAQLPSESELAEEFVVSRMTARKAVDLLASRGLIFRRPGKGTFVAGQKITHQFSTKVSFSAAMDALGLSHATRVLDARTIPAPQSVAEALSLPAGAGVVKIRRLRVVADKPAALHTAYLPERFAALLDEDLRGSLTDLMRHLGAVVEDARDWVEAVVAARDDADLLNVPPGSPLVQVQGIGFTSLRDPVRYTAALYRADRFRFSVDTSQPASLQVEFKRDDGAGPA